MKPITMRRLTLILFFIALETIIFMVSRFGISYELTVLIALPFASSMAARAIAYLDIFEWLRAPFTDVTKHSSGEGECVNPKPHPVRGVVGGLLSCINCAGMWAAVLLLVLYTFEPNMGRYTIYALGAAGLSALITRSIETVEWIGHYAHEMTAQVNMENRKEQAVLAEMATLPSLVSMMKEFPMSETLKEMGLNLFEKKS